MFTLPPDVIAPFASTLVVACGMIVLGLNTRLLQRQGRTCPSCGRWIRRAGRCPCVDSAR
jgi:hypothetical protein